MKINPVRCPCGHTGPLKDGNKCEICGTELKDEQIKKGEEEAAKDPML